MAWEISIGPEGWSEIRAAVANMPVERLARAVANWNHACFHGLSFHDLPANPHHKGSWSWKKVLNNRDFRRLGPEFTREVLAEQVMEQIESVMLCDNGGNGYYMDHEGYEQVFIPEDLPDSSDGEGKCSARPEEGGPCGQPDKCKTYPFFCTD